jgi:hypothetical protein
LIKPVLLKVPPPEVIDQVPPLPFAGVELPPIIAPVKGIATGFADWHTPTSGPPASMVNVEVTSRRITSLALEHPARVVTTNLK